MEQIGQPSLNDIADPRVVDGLTPSPRPTADAPKRNRNCKSAERQRAAETLQHSAAAAASETLLSERTRELFVANEKLRTEVVARAQIEDVLRQAQKMEAVGHLASGIVHDFNNMLNAIMCSLDMMRQGIDSGRTHGLQRYMSNAVASTERAAALSRRLLDFACQRTFDPQPVDVHRILNASKELFRSIVGTRIELDIDMAAEIWPIVCDPNEFENAILNLIVNARHAMPAGGRLLIKVSNLVVDEAAAITLGGDIGRGKFVMIEVSDTGVGMSEDVIARAFEPFFTTKPSGQGTGLGLPMVYGFAEQSGGSIRVASEIGSGSTFSLYLPCYRGRTKAPAPRPAGCFAAMPAAGSHL